MTGSDQNDAPDLKPCPFCGGTARIYHNTSPPGNSCEWHLASIVCSGCEIGVYQEVTPEEAISAWNRRVN
ncbi:Lar family restriction alleviation protein [Pelagibacterium lentulum]|uniref:Restriction alleviation protein, Lar family n=1 Tax=Pelagibacterium lentulum TaxID=2029865 RepID=A0A916RDJ4_9HYPH|nr:hypothetical protein GCM10011499_16260 [Pelagibacterium lentulum]